MWLGLNMLLQSSCNCIRNYFFSQVRSVTPTGLGWCSWNVNRSAACWAKGTKLTVLPCSQKKRENASRYYHEWSHTRIVTCCPDSVLQCLYYSMLMQHDRLSCSKPESTGGLFCAILLSHWVAELMSSSPNVPILVSQWCKMVVKCHCFWLNVVFSPSSLPL